VPHWFRFVLLGAVQGITEFVPVSSSGHLVLLQRLLGIQYPGISLEIAVHCGTLVAVLAIYGRDCGKIAASVMRTVPAVLRGEVSPSQSLREPELSMALHIGIASLATVFVVGPVLDPLRGAFESLPVVCLAWVFTAVLLLLTRRLHPAGRAVRLEAALLVGLMQGLAAVPGISRSGVTIAAGLFCGLSRREAARFSFLLSIPVVLGAVLLDLPAALAVPAGPGFWDDALLAAGIAAVSGFFALRLVVDRVLRGRLHQFAYYLLPLALVVSGVQLLV